MSDRFTEKAENALNKSVKIAEALGHTYIGTEHILSALADDELSCAALILKKNGISKDKINNAIKEYSGTGVKSSLSSKDLTPRARKILEVSYNNSLEHGDGTIGTEHILLSLIEEKDSVAIKLLKNVKADFSAIRDDVYTLIKSRERTLRTVKSETHSPILKQYGKNLCELAKEEKFDPVIGRDKETDRLIRVLLRKSKNNPCLIGEAGVGKTAIVEGLAQRIVKNEVPAALIGKTIISIDLTAMVAGAKYRGDFEDRIKNIISEVIKHKDIILFIDEIHTIVGAGAAEGAIDASNILKPQLARGDIQVIGATTHEEYRKYIEKDAALERRFQPIQVCEPNIDEATDMLFALKGRYEAHHNVIIDDDAIKECVVLSSKYISDRFLPDKAIDVLDEACALVSNNLHEIENQNDILKQYCNFESKKEKNILDIKAICEAEYPIKSKAFSAPHVTVSVIKDVISEASGIPANMIRKSVDYGALERTLNSTVIGQNTAVRKLVAALKRAALGFGNEDRPRGIFMFVGESGVGKTALALALEKSLYHRSGNLLRFDMAEYSEKQSISKLIGSPPGYVGHGEGGTLTEAIRRKPNSIVLLDEIEKADKEILNILLQISDYGYLTDSSGKRVSFKNAIIIATTNIGSAKETERVGFESTKSENQALKIISQLKKHYKEELINRFDEIIYFSALNGDVLKKIIINRLNELAKSLLAKGCIFNYTDEVVEKLAASNNIKGFGARPVLREINSEIEDKIIDLFLNGDSKAKQIDAFVIDGEIVISEKKAVKT